MERKIIKVFNQGNNSITPSSNGVEVDWKVGGGRGKSWKDEPERGRGQT